jgi:hypothetical protein
MIRSCIRFEVHVKVLYFSELKLIAELQDLPVDLESYVKRLSNARRRVMLVNNILQNAQVKSTIVHYY